MLLFDKMDLLGEVNIGTFGLSIDLNVEPLWGASSRMIYQPSRWTLMNARLVGLRVSVIIRGLDQGGLLMADLPIIYTVNGALYLAKTTWLKENKSFFLPIHWDTRCHLIGLRILTRPSIGMW